VSVSRDAQGRGCGGMTSPSLFAFQRLHPRVGWMLSGLNGPLLHVREGNSNAGAFSSPELRTIRAERSISTELQLTLWRTKLPLHGSLKMTALNKRCTRPGFGTRKRLDGDVKSFSE